MLKLLNLRSLFLFTCGLLFVFTANILTRPAPATAQSLMGDNSILADVSQLPSIPIQNFPDVEFTETLAAQLEAVGSTLAGQFEIGEMVKAIDVLLIGNFDLFGLPQMNLDQISGLANLDLNSIPVGDLSQLLENLTPAKLLETVGLENLGETLLQDAPLLGELASQLGTSPFDLSVSQAFSSIPGFENTPLSAIDPAALEGMTLGSAIPGLDQVPLQNIPGIEAVPLSGLGAAGVGQLSLGEMPNPLGLVAGFQLGVADIALGDPEGGDREQERVRVVSGGITDSDMKLTGARCPDESCPHFEISTGNPEVDGAAWMDSTGQRVPDGFGILCQPFGCEGPPGNHPFGEAVRVLLRDIDQSAGTAQVALSFPVCKTILFIGKTCTPWIFPSPDGIPIATIAEKSIVPFVMPNDYTDGEVAHANPPAAIAMTKPDVEQQPQSQLQPQPKPERLSLLTGSALSPASNQFAFHFAR